MHLRFSSLLIAIIASAAAVHAGDVHIVQGSAGGTPLGPAVTLLWSTDALFLNTGTADATVQLMSTSNGGWQRGMPSITIPPGRSASLTRTVAGNLSPIAPTTLWVLRADVPPGVQVESPPLHRLVLRHRRGSATVAIAVPIRQSPTTCLHGSRSGKRESVPPRDVPR